MLHDANTTQRNVFAVINARRLLISPKSIHVTIRSLCEGLRLSFIYALADFFDLPSLNYTSSLCHIVIVLSSLL